MEKMKESFTRASSVVRRNFSSTDSSMPASKSRSNTGSHNSVIFPPEASLASNRGGGDTLPIADLTEAMRFLIEGDGDLLSIALKKKLSETHSPPTNSEESAFTAGSVLKNHANGFPLFYEFMENSFAEEHLNFLADVGKFKRQMVEQADHIFNKYFNKNSELSCDELTKQDIAQDIKSNSISVNLFTRASAEILRLVVDIYFPRFTCTEQFQQWKNLAREKAVHDAKIDAKRLKKKMKDKPISHSNSSLALVPGISVGTVGPTPIGSQGEIDIENMAQYQKNLIITQLKEGTITAHTIKDALEHGFFSINDSIDESKQTLLHLACAYSSPTPNSLNTNVIQYLLESKANPNANDERNWTPLHAACSASNIAACNLLLQHQADVSAANKEGVLPLHYLVKSEQYFSTSSVSVSASTSPTSSGDYHYLPGMTSLVTLTNILSPDLYEQYLSITEKMITLGASPSHQTAKSETPLHYACSSKRPKTEVIKLLVKHDSPVDTRSKRGHTPLHLAILVGCAENVKAMLDCGADVKIFGTNNSTTLDMARGKPAITAVLVAHFAKLRKKEEGSEARIASHYNLRSDLSTQSDT